MVLLMNATELRDVWRYLETVAEEEHASGALEAMLAGDALCWPDETLREWMRSNRTENDVIGLRQAQDWAKKDGYDD